MLRLSTFIEIIKNHLNVEVVRPFSLFKEDLGADSLDMVELIMVMEDEFGVELEDNEALDRVERASSLWKLFYEQADRDAGLEAERVGGDRSPHGTIA